MQAFYYSSENANIVKVSKLCRKSETFKYPLNLAEFNHKVEAAVFKLCNEPETDFLGVVPFLDRVELNLGRQQPNLGQLEPGAAPDEAARADGQSREQHHSSTIERVAQKKALGCVPERVQTFDF